MRTIVKLYGDLGKKFGRRFELDISTPIEAIRALMVLRPGFAQHLYQYSTPGYHIVLGHGDLMEVELRMHNLLKEGMVLRIIPVVQGAGKSPWVNIVIGAALIYLTAGTGTFAAGGWLAGATSVGFAAAMGTAIGYIGASLLLGGVSQLLARPPELSGGPNDRPENKPSYAFDGPVNTEAQGYPVPVGYGMLIVGGARISVGISAEDYTPGQEEPLGFHIVGLSSFSFGINEEGGETGVTVDIQLKVTESVGACSWSITGDPALSLSASTSETIQLQSSGEIGTGMYEVDVTVEDSSSPTPQTTTKHIVVEVYSVDRGDTGLPTEGL